MQILFEKEIILKKSYILPGLVLILKQNPKGGELKTEQKLQQRNVPYAPFFSIHFVLSDSDISGFNYMYRHVHVYILCTTNATQLGA
jgi:hypothetical protein